jgi:preprotein translocase subunit SecF
MKNKLAHFFKVTFIGIAIMLVIISILLFNAKSLSKIVDLVGGTTFALTLYALMITIFYFMPDKSKNKKSLNNNESVQ